MFRNVLVAVDSTRDVHPELGRAIHLAKESGGVIRIIDVIKDPSVFSQWLAPDSVEIEQQLAAQRQESLEQLASRCRQEGLEATCAILRGRSSEQILAEAIRIGADLIIRYARGARSLSIGKLGATAQRLVQRAPCPLFLHRPQHEPIKKIVAAVDATPQDEEHGALNCQILEAANQIARSCTAELTMVYAWTLYGDHLLRNRMPPAQYTALVEHVKKQHVEGFNQLLTSSQIPTSAGMLLQGNPSEAVPGFCEQTGADLLVCGTLARRGLSGLLLGNTIERIMQQVDCSILAIPPK
jgi:universal stress protein E